MKEQETRNFFSRLGIKNTKQRKMVLNLLKNTDELLSAEQIYTGLKNQDENINLSTVYRILELFVSKGILVKSTIPNDSKSVFEINHSEHQHHLICMRCKKIIPVNSCPLENFEKSLRENTEFDITGHKLEIFGYCPKCKSKE